ncbi:MAG: ABC transporter ATP-binding protein, partial [Cellvibrionales bacterium]|nr:ABC transporter ATP-binding protein [Cellvibrionales bacterium]
LSLLDVKVEYQLSKSWKEKQFHQALNGVTFDVFAGDAVGIVGRNGSGKSTLLKLMARVIIPDSGEVKFYSNKISLLSLHSGFDPSLSGRKNAIVSGMFLGFSYEEMRDRLEEIKAFSELEEFFEVPVKKYSSGMRSKLGFSIAMIANPDLLLVDEVLAVGDAHYRKKSEEKINEKLSEGMSVVLVSHSEDQIRKVAKKVIWIDKGQVNAIGLPDEVFESYKKND